MEKLTKIQKLLNGKGEILVRSETNGLWFVHVYMITDKPMVHDKIEFNTGGSMIISSCANTVIKCNTDNLDVFLDDVIRILEREGM